MIDINRFILQFYKYTFERGKEEERKEISDKREGRDTEEAGRLAKSKIGLQRGGGKR